MSHFLRVLTLNIWNYNEPWIRRRDLIVETIRQHNPDIIGFQEIRHNGSKNDRGKNQAQQLAERLFDYFYIYQPAQRNPEKDQWEGLSIFSKWPFLSSSFIALSRDGADNRDNHQRIVLHAELQTRAGSLHFFNTHLSLSQKGRSRTVREITAYMSRYTGDLPSILVGDFNEVPDQPPICHITQESHLIDAYAQTHPGDPGWTFTDENPYVQKGNDHRRGHRIDYIFAQPPKSNSGQLLVCTRIADQPAPDGHFASDHFGLMADFNLKG
jgi:endonuclease/exonuclease/phosphatase family metal-dependent hydrolase